MAIQWAITKPTEMTQSIAGMGTLALIGFSGLVLGLIAKWVLTLRQMALMRMAGGFSTDWQEAYRAVSDRKWQVVALWILMAISSVAIFIIWLVQCFVLVRNPRSGPDMIPFILLGIVFLVVSLGILFFAGYMSLCLLACDKLTFKETVDRTVLLISHNFMRCFGFSLAFILTICVLSYPLSMPIAILGIWDNYRLGIGHSHSEVPMLTMIVGHVWESVITLLISPLFSFAFAIFYVDLLNRKEGLDLTRRLNILRPVPENIPEDLPMDTNKYGTERS